MRFFRRFLLWLGLSFAPYWKRHVKASVEWTILVVITSLVLTTWIAGMVNGASGWKVVICNVSNLYSTLLFSGALFSVVVSASWDVSLRNKYAHEGQEEVVVPQWAIIWAIIFILIYILDMAVLRSNLIKCESEHVNGLNAGKMITTSFYNLWGWDALRVVLLLLYLSLAAYIKSISFVDRQKNRRKTG